MIAPEGVAAVKEPPAPVRDRPSPPLSPDAAHVSTDPHRGTTPPARGARSGGTGRLGLLALLGLALILAALFLSSEKPRGVVVAVRETAGPSYLPRHFVITCLYRGRLRSYAVSRAFFESVAVGDTLSTR